MEKDSFALEMLKEMKLQSKRWFIIAVIELVLLVGSNIGWLIYESQYETVYEEEVQTMEDIDNSNNSNYTQTIH